MSVDCSLSQGRIYISVPQHFESLLTLITAVICDSEDDVIFSLLRIMCPFHVISFQFFGKFVSISSSFISMCREVCVPFVISVCREVCVHFMLFQFVEKCVSVLCYFISVCREVYVHFMWFHFSLQRSLCPFYVI